MSPEWVRKSLECFQYWYVQLRSVVHTSSCFWTCTLDLIVTLVCNYSHPKICFSRDKSIGTNMEHRNSRSEHRSWYRIDVKQGI
jgi:hypothetical protein